MDCIIDANVLMSILISGRASYKTILTFNNFIVPDFALIEIDKYKDTLMSRTKLSQSQLINWTLVVFQELTIIPQYVVEDSVLEKTASLVKNIDSKDTAYVALALQFDLPLITRDVPLYEGLKKKGFKKIILFEDFLKMIG